MRKLKDLIEQFCGNCGLKQRCFEMYLKEDDSPCEAWEFNKKIIYHSKVLKISYKQKYRLFMKHLKVVCDSYWDYINNEGSGCSYCLDNVDKEIGADCEKCCVVRENKRNLRGKFNPALDKIIK